MRAFHKNIIDLKGASENCHEKAILDRLSEGNTDIRDLVERLDGQKPAKTFFTNTTKAALTAEIDRRIATLREMVDQYTKLVPVFIELGYVGDAKLYNPNGRNSDVPDAVRNILREMRDVPEELKRLDPHSSKVDVFSPHAIFKNCHALRAGYHEAEVNSMLTPEQRKLVSWAQTQVGRYSVYDTIDQVTVAAALSPKNIDAAEKGFSNWQKYLERGLAATKDESPHAATKRQLDAVIADMKPLFSIDDNSFDVDLKHLERRMDTFNALSNFEQYISKAVGAKPKAVAILNKPLLTAEDAISSLREIDPHLTLTGVLQEAQGSPDQAALYKDRVFT